MGIVKPDGNYAIDPKTKELVPEYQLVVFVPGGADQPRQTTYVFPE